MLSDAAQDLALGIDSFVLCLGLGPLYRSWRAWPVLAAAFGAADGAAGLLGHGLAAAWPQLPPMLDGLGPLALAAYGCVVLVATSCVREAATSPLTLAAMPPLLALDNLVAGAAGGGGAGQAVTQAAATGAMAMAGCALGELVARGARVPPWRLAGGAALAAAAAMVLG